MAEPASSSVSTLYVGGALAALAPLIDGDALFGAFLGGWLVAATQRHFKAWQRLASMALSVGVGYLFSPVVQPLLPVLSSGAAAFFGALLVIPVSIKVRAWAHAADLQEIIRRIKGG